MPRVIGIDPGTVSIDLCGLDGSEVFLDRALPTADALADPSIIIALLRDAGPLDLVAGPSGYGLPLTPAREATEADLRLAYLAAEGERGGIGGLRSLVRALGRSTLPVLLTPGVVHLASVPAHRKVNRADMGTAEKVCAAALAVHEQAARRGCGVHEVSCILLELGGAFTAALAVRDGAIVDGLGGSSGPIGLRAAGALDGEVAFLAGSISKATLFGGGVAAIAGRSGAEAWPPPDDDAGRVARDAYVEGALKAVATLVVSVPAPREIVLSGRLAADAPLVQELRDRLARVVPGVAVVPLTGFAREAGQAAQGAALVADGLAGGASAPLVDALGIREARGSALDHLYVISPDAARRRLGLP